MIRDVLSLTAVEREELESRCRSRRLRAEDARRARLILMPARSSDLTAVQAALGCDPGYVSRWKRRFEAERLAGLYSRHRGSKARALTPKLQARILEKTRQKPSEGSTHWSTRRLAEAMGLNHMLGARAWARAGVKPHRMKRYMTSDDPDFESKAAEVIG